MAKTTPMSDDELRALTDAELRQSVGYWGGKLAEQRRKAEYYYLGLAKGDLSPPEIEGRSSVVSPDVRNTIESMLPGIVDTFAGGEKVVEFEPSQEGDEDKAELCTDYINYLFFKKNNGHKIIVTWAKDGLLQKTGIVKCWWDTRDEEKREEYRGLDDVELAQILDDPEVEAKEHDSYPDEEDAKHRKEAIQHLTQQLQQAMQGAQQGQPQQPQQGQQPGMPPQQPNPAMQAAQQIQAQIQHIESLPPKMLHDVTMIRTKSGGKLAIENVPPEEFMISREAKDIQTARMVGHRVFRTHSELISMGYAQSLVESLASDDANTALNAERIERVGWDDESAYLNLEMQGLDKSQQGVWVSEMYLRCDYDGDGIAELRRVTRAGNEILDNEVVDAAPFAAWCPVPLPHRFFGLSIADLGFEAQRSKTSLLRAVHDNLYLTTNQRMFAVENQVNLDDLLTSRPGGVVRVKQPGAVGPLSPGAGNFAPAMEMMQYMEEFLEQSTGWHRDSQGNDASPLNQTATAANIFTNRSDMRLDLIKRNFAEGFCDLFRLMLKLVCQNQNQAQIAHIAGKWIPIDPREWRNQFDVTINVGLGTGNKDQKVQHLMMLAQRQGEGLQIGVATPENIYNANAEMVKLLGFKSPDRFFSDPSQPNQQTGQPFQPPPNPDVMKIQMESQARQQESQQDLQLKQQELQMKMQADQHEQEMQAAQVQQQNQMEMARTEREMQLKAQIRQMELAQEAQLEQQRGERQRQTELENTAMEVAGKIEVARISAASATDAATAGADTNVMMQSLLETQQALLAQIGRPKTIVRDEMGRAQGIA